MNAHLTTLDTNKTISIKPRGAFDDATYSPSPDLSIHHSVTSTFAISAVPHDPMSTSETILDPSAREITTRSDFVFPDPVSADESYTIDPLNITSSLETSKRKLNDLYFNIYKNFDYFLFYY